MNNKIIVVLGPTASGKTKLGVYLANKFNGEIVSADSRQVYKGMDVGTGKDLSQFSITNFQFSNKSKVQNSKSKIQIPYHLIDVVSPNTEFNLAKYQKLAYEAIDDILKRDKIPILVGGTGLYLQAVVDNYNLSNVKPNKKLREKLENQTEQQLFDVLKKINPIKAEELNNSDKKNKRRLIRCIEMCGKQILAPGKDTGGHKSNYQFLLIGLIHSKEILHEKIYKRLIERLEKQDMIGEVERLHTQQKVSWKKLQNFGLEYKYISLYLQKKVNYQELVEKIDIASRQFAKRQITWFKRWERNGAKIYWVKNKKQAEKLIKNFLLIIF
ncbi:MAG: tRNA (adenosine(37)-N6)-dimethylallyltransferase MiaA [Patescibacteria group bacterium]|nr:tRNA (adenosine(37)-N6)-dimethylallyltransferase MiaA [Patescibacteria group bacterium]